MAVKKTVDKKKNHYRTAKDISDRRQVESALQERLKFEQLVSSISANLVRPPAEKIDSAIESGLELLGKYLDADRCAIVLLTQNGEHVGPRYDWHSDRLGSFRDILPLRTPRCIREDVLKGKTSFFRRIEDIPESDKDFRAFFERLGLKSAVSVPLTAGGELFGALTVESVAVEQSLPYEVVERLSFVGEIFVSAMARKKAEQSIQEYLSEIDELKKRLQAENIYLREEINLEHDFGKIIGESAALKSVLYKVEQVAITDTTVLILGESGVGKELIARAIHDSSKRSERPLVKVNCAALPPTLIENELFGHEEGAFTGARTKRPGRFEIADGSTIFLDEIGEIPLELQAKLLRVIEDGEFERVGSPHTVKVGARILAATNRDLEELVRTGRFREDLFFRLNIFPITLPPLRERREDIPHLVNTFIAKCCKKLGKQQVTKMPRNAMDRLISYDWPGNVRELENVIERAVVLSKGSRLNLEYPRAREHKILPKMTLNEVEREHILDVLERTRWRIRGTKGAAEILGLKPTTLEARMKKLNIKRDKALSIIT